VLLVHPLLAHYSPSLLLSQPHSRLALQYEDIGLPPSTRVSEYLRDAAYVAAFAAWGNPRKQHKWCNGEVGTGSPACVASLPWAGDVLVYIPST
jgi:hypothetical protein